MSLEIIKELNIDFYDTRYIAINAKQNDQSSRYILVTCYDRGTIYPIDNVYNYAYVRYRKPDELNVFNSCEVTEDGKILIELTTQMLRFVGKSFVDLVIVHNEPIPAESITVNNGELLTNENTGVVSTMLFCINVMEAALDNSEIESTDEYGALNDLLIKATEDYTYVMAACKVSEDNAKLSETNAKTSEDNAKVSEENAATSEANAKISEDNAEKSAANAKTSETNAKTYEENASNYADIAAEKAEEASQFVSEYENNLQITSDKAAESSNYATLSKSYAVGETGTRTDEDTDNAKYYYSQAKFVSDSMGGIFSPQGTIKFTELSTAYKAAGYVYHIEDEFVTDDTFKDGAGVSYPAGTSVYCTADGYWDCFVRESLVVTDDGEGNVEIVCTYDFITTYDNSLAQTIVELQERINALESQTVLEVVE